MEDAESKKFLESSLCLMTPSHGNMAENSAFQKGNQCLFCVAEVSSKSESEETPPSKWMMLMPKYGDKFNNYYNRPHETECRCQMKLRSRKRPNFG